MEYFLQIALNTVVLSSTYALLALGFNFLYSTNKFFDLSYASYLILGDYLFLVLSKAHMPFTITVFLTIILTILFGLAIETLLYAKLRVKKSSGSVMMIASLGALTVTQALLAILFTSNVQTFGTEIKVLPLTTLSITFVQATMVVVAVGIYLCVYIILKRTRFGLQLRALSDNEELATTSYLPIKKIRYVALSLGVATGVIASVLCAMDTSFDPYTGMSLLLKGVIVAIIGGLGNMLYGAIGAILLATIETAAVWYIGVNGKMLLHSLFSLSFSLSDLLVYSSNSHGLHYSSSYSHSTLSPVRAFT